MSQKEQDSPTAMGDTEDPSTAMGDTEDPFTAMGDTEDPPTASSVVGRNYPWKKMVDYVNELNTMYQTPDPNYQRQIEEMLGVIVNTIVMWGNERYGQHRKSRTRCGSKIRNRR